MTERPSQPMRLAVRQWILGVTSYRKLRIAFIPVSLLAIAILPP